MREEEREQLLELLEQYREEQGDNKYIKRIEAIESRIREEKMKYEIDIEEVITKYYTITIECEDEEEGERTAGFLEMDLPTFHSIDDIKKYLEEDDIKVVKIKDEAEGKWTQENTEGGRVEYEVGGHRVS